MKKHTGKTKYACPVLGCQQTFYREDKVQLHIRQTDNDGDEAFFKSGPWELGPLPPILIPSKYYEMSDWFRFPVSQIIARMGQSERTCPLNGCPYLGDVSSMLGHLRSHKSQELKENEKVLQGLGDSPTTFEIICPLCHTQSGSTYDFQKHFEDTHVRRDARHFHLYRDALRSTLEVSGYSLYDGNPWTGWPTSSPPFQVTCPVCEKDIRSHGEPLHHLELLNDLSNMTVHQLCIVIRFLPGFNDHPVFEKICPSPRPVQLWRHSIRKASIW